MPEKIDLIYNLFRKKYGEGAVRHWYSGMEERVPIEAKLK